MHSLVMLPISEGLIAIVIKKLQAHVCNAPYAVVPSTGGLTVKCNAAVRASSRKSFCLAYLGEPSGAPDSFLCFGVCSDTGFGLHGPDLDLAIKRA